MIPQRQPNSGSPASVEALGVKNLWQVDSNRQPSRAARLRELTGPLTSRWLAFWSFLVAGLAIGGRGFAYIGLPPLFISEIVLVCGVAVLLLQPRWRELLGQPTTLITLCLMGWCLLRSLPYVGVYGIDSIRDFMLVGYATIGLVVAGVIISYPRSIPILIGRYRRFAKVFLAVMPGLWLMGRSLGDSTPGWPWAPHVGILDLKPGDMPVHLGGIAALIVVGWFGGRSLFWTAALVCLVGVTGMVSRGGLLAFTLALGIAFFVRPKSAWPFRMVAVVLILLSVAIVFDIRVPMGTREREFSAQQLLDNFVSVVSSDDRGDLDDTKQWRLQWWHDIFGYTLGGEYFWTGKGFGVNLATADGYQVNSDNSLRSPHNGHLTLLARGGVPAFALWVMLQICWLTTIATAYINARRRNETHWAMWFGLLVAYWGALMLNAAVDVYFEGPMGGIWYWSIIGLGIGSSWVFYHSPEVMRDLSLSPQTRAIR